MTKDKIKKYKLSIAALCRGGIENRELALELVCGADGVCPPSGSPPPAGSSPGPGEGSQVSKTFFCESHCLPLSRDKKLKTNTYRKQPSFTASRGPAGLRDAVNRRTTEEGDLQPIFIFSFLSRGNGIRWLPQEKAPISRAPSPPGRPVFGLRV